MPFGGDIYMASREEVALFRAARAGNSSAQVALGKQYLRGGSGLPQSAISALYWLERAARAGDEDAWMLIGSHISFEAAIQAPDPLGLCVWYARAFDSGVVPAGLILAKLVLAIGKDEVEPMWDKAWSALEVAAESGIAEAQWLLAQQIKERDTAGHHGAAGLQAEQNPNAYLKWARLAADNGIPDARRLLAEHAWHASDHVEFLYWALPIARAIVGPTLRGNSAGQNVSDEDAELLFRCAYARIRTNHCDTEEIEEFWQLAAESGNKHAQFWLGLWFAKVDERNNALASIPRPTNYWKAVHWLTLAGRQGVGDAWYAMSKIYLKSEFMHRSLDEAEVCLTYAAEAGHAGAQLELGKRAWRNRRRKRSNDVLAVYWLQKAAAQECVEAQQLLGKVTDAAIPAVWAQTALHRMSIAPSSSLACRLLAARVELAALFGLSQREALLIDINKADRGHCLAIDIREQYARGKRRLIQVQRQDERHILDRIKTLFEHMDCGANGPEGNYRQRLYRLKRVLSPARFNEQNEKSLVPSRKAASL